MILCAVFFENPVAAILARNWQRNEIRHEIAETEVLIIFCKKVTANKRNKI
jgi:hypothetical protein